MKKIIGLSCILISSVFANQQLDDMKEIIKQQQLRLELLEKKIEINEESKFAKNQDASSSFSQKAYLPDIAFIANMSALARDVENEKYSNYAIDGFINKAGEIPFNKKRGFNLNYGEMEISSSVDPYFDIDAALHIEKEGLHIGELYITTRALPYGLRLKSGKFKSEFGRINSKHQHSWDFSAIPLLFEAYFGAGGLGDEGLQLQYTPPIDTFVQLGFEAMQGGNGRSFGDTDKNNLNIVYLKSSFDLNDEISLLYGGTWMSGKNRDGDTDIYGGDLTIKYIIDSYSSLSWQSELLYRDKDIENETLKQAGLYSEVVFDIDQNWATGVRYDTLFKNIDNQPDDLNRYTAMLQYKPFEFSKIRLQYTYDKSKSFAGKREDIQEIMLGFTIESGAHGAHSF
jgi:hypothetical protein